MTDHVTRRDFVTAASALAGAALLPAAATAGRARVGAADGSVVLFQGDSITDAGRDRGVADPNSASALGSGYPLLVASAALAAHPDRGLRFYNRGISVNDFWHKLSSGYTGTVEDYEHQYTALLDDTRRALPRTRLIVLEPFVLRCGAVDDRWFPEFDQRRAAAERVAGRAGAAFVPLQRVFNDLARRSAPQYWAADGVHPTPAGHAAIAEQWRRAAKL